MTRVCQVMCLVAVFALSAAAEPRPDKVRKHKDQAVREEYIVVLRDGYAPEEVEPIAKEIAKAHKVKLEQLFAYALQGFLVSGKEENIEELAGDERVLYVEQNAEGSMPETFSAMQWTVWNNEYLWHLDRLDELSYAQRDSQHNMCTEGRTAVAYVIDTGIFNHSEFETPTRLVRSVNFAGAANGAVDTLAGCGPTDRLTSTTHGTWVASALAGTHIGASKARLVSLRVRDCELNGTASDLIEALDWIAGPNNPYRGSPGVINHSGFVPVWDSVFASYGTAVDRTVNATNIPFFTSADNYSTDACKFSPNHRAYTRISKTGRAFVVGGTSTSGVAGDNNDYRYQEWLNGLPRIGGSSGSNGGACVSIYAPAVSIYVAQNLNTTSYARYNGTSFASPLVAGIAARYMVKQKAATGVTPTATQVYEWLLAQSQTVVQNTTTAPTYWMCVRPNPGFGWAEQSYREKPEFCPTNYLGPYEMPSATNTSNARMVFWDEGFCP